MQLEQLQIDLRPRPHAQALDLGFTLLRLGAADIYLAWLALWLPLMALCAGLASLWPDYGGLWLMLAWWLKPLLERAPLYILSRQVFGATVSWREAVRAWPGQLGGGWFRMLTWWRPLVPGRGLYQAIWQLEGARGAAAAERRRVIGGNRTARSAAWFGVVCAHFELILQIGLIAFIGIFLNRENVVNPFAYLFGNTGQPVSALLLAVTFAGYAFAGGIIGPIYTACCFTLYLNRRATLEAWDIEIMLRQIKPPAGAKSRGAAATALLLPALLALALYRPAPAAAAATAAAAQTCSAPQWMKERQAAHAKLRGPDQSAEQTRLRREVADLFDSDALRGYLCEQTWQLKNPAAGAPKTVPAAAPDFSFLAHLLQALCIAAAIGGTAWLLYRYREKLPGLARPPATGKATTIGGLDIRPETLPADVAAAVHRLWQAGQRRAALALLYRATLSRLADEDGLALTQGATEGDCLRLAAQAQAQRGLSMAKLEIATCATRLWLNAAYGNRWPDSDALAAHCAQWQTHFGQAAARPAPR